MANQDWMEGTRTDDDMIPNLDAEVGDGSVSDEHDGLHAPSPLSEDKPNQPKVWLGLDIASFTLNPH